MHVRKAYIGQTGCSTETRIEEYHWHIRLYRAEKSTVAERSKNLDHHIQFHDTSILTKEHGHMERVIREATEIELPPSNMNREEMFLIEQVMEPIIQTMKE
jgi:hypothetical protein